MANALGQGPRRPDQRARGERRPQPFFRAIWPHRAITPIDNGFEWVDESGPKKQPSLARKNSIRQL